MDKGKLYPIIITVILIFLALFLFANKNKKSDEYYPKLIVIYNNQTHEYEKLNTDQFIKHGDVDFYVVSNEGNKMVLITDVEVTLDGKKTKEILIEAKKEYTICMSENDCLTARLSR